MKLDNNKIFIVWDFIYKYSLIINMHPMLNLEDLHTNVYIQNPRGFTMHTKPDVLYINIL